ncbi:MAG: prepilin-type N-terminal cleavage/methylation domain-containing protein [Methylotenera sp.]|nr:prepilin-type N-terminal cleavage/methylation domain-containing protein [Methylotenera sp.]
MEQFSANSLLDLDKSNQFKVKLIRQSGFSLVELMVGLVIGLLATMVIMQVYSAFEGQKRTTTGTADAQTTGSVALYSLQREVQLAGYGLPLFDEQNSPLLCAAPPTVDHDNSAGTPNIRLDALDIIDGGVASGASDIVVIRYGTSNSGGAPTCVTANGAVQPEYDVNSNMGCANGDVVMMITGTNCFATTVDDTDLADTKKITLKASDLGVSRGVCGPGITKLSCLGRWNEFTYQVDVATSQLTRQAANEAAPSPIADGIVSIQAQYGISITPDNNQVIQWVDPVGAWASGAIGNTSANCDAGVANRNCIKAVRIAVVARNGLREKDVVTTACSSIIDANPTGICAWDATSAVPTVVSPAPQIDLSNTADWNHYRYSVYETIIPLRNIIWARGRL